MRHYVWSDASGYLRGFSSAPEGWPDGCDPSDPYTTQLHAQALRRRFLETLGWNLVGAFPIDCPCPIGAKGCLCGGICVRDYYMGDGGVLIAKPPMELIVDGIARTPSSEPLDAPPGTAVRLSLRGGAPDGHSITADRYGADVSRTNPVLTFTGGETNTVELRTPAQGMVGGLNGASKYVTTMVIVLRGWAT